MSLSNHGQVVAYQFWQHATSGDKFAVAIVDGRVISAVGPLEVRDIHPDYTNDIDDDSGNWVADAGSFDFDDLDAMETGQWVAITDGEAPESPWTLARILDAPDSDQYDNGR